MSNDTNFKDVDVLKEKGGKKWKLQLQTSRTLSSLPSQEEPRIWGEKIHYFRKLWDRYYPKLIGRFKFSLKKRESKGEREKEILRDKFVDIGTDSF